MSAPLFTPGPWGVEQIGGSIYVGKLRVGEGRSGFDDVLYATDCKDYTAKAVARELANARLIAAAPTMYERLVDARHQLRHLTRGEGDTLALIETIDALLAKARGEAA